MISATLPACPVCCQHSWSGIWPGTRLRSCRGCGTVFNDRSASRQEEERHYLSYSRAPSPLAGSIAEAQWRWLVRAIGNGAAPRSVLDVGCGHGDFLLVARAAGAQVAGLELDPAGVASCRHRGLPVVAGSLFDVDLPPGLWEVVTLWDVLEHLEHPREALARICGALAPGGALVLRGRNAALHAPWKAGYARARRLARWLHVPDLSCVHRWGFRPEGYARLLKERGLQEVRLYPGLPTPGDRSGLLCGHWRVALIKGTLSLAGTAVHRLSGGRCYPFPSVLISARRAAEAGPAGREATNSPVLMAAVADRGAAGVSLLSTPPPRPARAAHDRRSAIVSKRVSGIGWRRLHWQPHGASPPGRGTCADRLP